MSLLDTLLIAYLFVGCVYWMWTMVGAVRIRRAVPVLARQKPPQPARWPRLSIIVPACNEADSLEEAAATLLAQDYPDLEIILIDDRSTDGTGRLVDRIAACDRRVLPLHIASLPEGWLGKTHALARGVEMAGGEWLLFTDADVQFPRRDALRRFVAWAEHRGIDHLAAAPDIWTRRAGSRPSLLLEATITLFLRTGCVAARLWAVGDPRSTAFIGVGAFNLVRGSAFERTAGFDWLRLEVVDDLGLGLLMKRSGARAAVVNGTELVGLDWYRSIGQMARGLEKGFASIAGCSVPRMTGICAVLAALELAPLVALLPWGIEGLATVGLVMLALEAFSSIVICRWAHRRLGPILLAPVALGIIVAMMLRSAWLGWRRGGILWRGTLYPSETLRRGSRVKLASWSCRQRA